MTAADLTDRATNLPLDSHLHTNLSPDSSVPIDAYAAQAVEQGIAEIAITDHVDFEPGAPAYEFVPFATRERVVREAAERWGPRGVAIRFGVEITYDSRYESAIRDHLDRHRYDYVIGSVHVYADSPYHASRVNAWIAGRSLAEIVAPYFDEVERAIRSELFDTIGHLDFVKRYLHPHVTAADLAAAPELYEPLLVALVETGTGARGEHERPSPGRAGDVPVRRRRRQVPVARWHRRFGGIGCPYERVLLIGLGGGVSCCGRRGIPGSRVPPGRRQGRRDPAGPVRHAGSHLTRLLVPSL